MLLLSYILRALLAIDQLEFNVKEAKAANEQPVAVAEPLTIEQPPSTRRPDQFDTSLGQYSNWPEIPLVIAKPTSATPIVSYESTEPMILEEPLLCVQPEEYQLKLPGKARLPDSVNALEYLKSKSFETQFEHNKKRPEPIIDTKALSESTKLKSVQSVNRNYFQDK
jgi:hypothetical protein